MVKLLETVLLRDPLGRAAAAGNGNPGLVTGIAHHTSRGILGWHDHIRLLAELANGVDDRGILVGALGTVIEGESQAGEREEGRDELHLVILGWSCVCDMCLMVMCNVMEDARRSRAFWVNLENKGTARIVCERPELSYVLMLLIAIAE